LILLEEQSVAAESPNIELQPQGIDVIALPKSEASIEFEWKEEEVMLEAPTIEMTRKQLYDEIWGISVAGIAKKYGATYGYLVKQIKEAGIPIPPSGYWTQISFGKPVEKTELQGPEDEIVVIYKTHPSARTRGTSGKPALKKTNVEKLKSVVAEPLRESSMPSFEQAKKAEAMAAIQAANAKALQEMGEPETTKNYGSIHNVYDREILYNEIWTLPVTEVAKKYKVSDVAIHKICKSLNIPTPPAGYWAKVYAGKPVPKQTPLPVSNGPKQKIGEQTGGTTSHGPLEVPALEFLDEEERSIVLAVAEQIPLTGENDKMNSKVAAHRNKKPNLWGSISQESLPRACRIIDSLIKAMEPMGCSLTEDLDFIVRGEKVHISVSESQTRTDHVLTKDEQRELLIYQDAKKRGKYASEPLISKYDYEYNSRLYFSTGDKRRISDTKSAKLEDRLGEILLCLYEVSEQIRVIRVEREEAERKRKQEEERREERKNRYNAEVKRTHGLLNAAEDYDIACKIRAYASAVEITGNLDEDKCAWVEWAKQKADWYDPTIARKDEFFGKRKYAENKDSKDLKEAYSWQF
jgi:hypothetical protein